MKNLFIFIFTIIVLLPPAHAHNDVVVYEDVLEHLDVDEEHEQQHHKNDTDEEKETEHHHHCTIISLSLEFIPIENNFEIIAFEEIQKQNSYYQIPQYTSYLSGVFQPPKSYLIIVC